MFWPDTELCACPWDGRTTLGSAGFLWTVTVLNKLFLADRKIFSPIPAMSEVFTSGGLILTAVLCAMGLISTRKGCFEFIGLFLFVVLFMLILSSVF